MSPATILVTGPSGQVGSHLVASLLSRGHQVRCLVQAHDRIPGDPPVERVVGDIRDSEIVRRAVEGVDVIYHLAAVVSTDDRPGEVLWTVNVGGTRRLARAARQAGVRRMVHFSSIVVFDPDPKHEPLDERRQRIGARRSSPYARSKIEGEAAVREEVERGLDAVVVHPTVVIGPHETHHAGVVRNLVAKQRAGRLPAVLSGGFNAVDVDDVVEGTIAAAGHGRTGESYILGGRWYSLAEFSQVAASVGVGPAPRVRIPLWAVKPTIPVSGWVASRLGRRPFLNVEEVRQLEGNPSIDLTKARDELGYRPRPIDDALRRCDRWLAQGL